MTPDEEFDRRCREALAEEGLGAVVVEVPDGLVVADYHRIIEKWRGLGWVPEMGMMQVVFYSPEYLHGEIDADLGERLGEIGARRTELKGQLAALEAEVFDAKREAALRHAEVDRGKMPLPYGGSGAGA